MHTKFIDTLQPSTSIWIWASELKGCKQPLLVSETLLKLCNLILDTKFWEEAHLIAFTAPISETLLIAKSTFLTPCAATKAGAH